MINVNKLKGILVEKNKTQEEIARYLGVARSTFYRKLSNGGTTFTVEEVVKMKEYIPLTNEEATLIFFSR